MREFFKNTIEVIGATLASVFIVIGIAMLVGTGLSFIPSPSTTPSTVEVLVNDKTGKSLGHGSGSYLGDGWYLTAAHVADGDNTLVIKHQNGVEVAVKAVHADKERDVALLFVGADVNIIPSVNLFCGYRSVGDDVYAKGYPMSLGLVETKGVISSVASQWGNWKSVYRTDVALGPGMSGGPVFDASGYQIGVNVGVALMPLGFGASTFGVNLVVPSAEVCDLKKVSEEVSVSSSGYSLYKTASGFWVVSGVGSNYYYKYFNTKFFAKRHIKNLLSNEDKTEYYIK